MDRRFTYGSLQPGGPNEHVLNGIDGAWQRATVCGFLVESGWGAELGYPALRLDDEGNPVPGFVFSSRALGDHWRRLDDFEGGQYRREIAEVTLDDGLLVAAYVYVLDEHAGHSP